MRSFIKQTELIASIFFVLFSNTAQASPLPPQPVCEIQAEITSPTEIKITENAQLIKKGYDDSWNCDYYSVGKSLTVIVSGLNGEPPKIKTGDVVKGNIQYIGDEHSQGYDFTIIEVIQNK